MGIQEAVIVCLSNYVGFEGRATRPQCWWWFLFIVAVWAILWALGNAILGADSGAGSVLGAMFGVVVFLPSLAVSARRLHDSDRTGWWLLLLLVPVIGWTVMVYFLVQPGSSGPNRFGD
jgi:uncharacterized membrane protein YhaH (DUF805 family)